MRAVVQRVSAAHVEIDEQPLAGSSIAQGVVVLLGVGREDGEEQARALAKKIVELRIFPGADGRMQNSLVKAGGACLVVSQFTLFGDCRKGRRPFFGAASEPQRAEVLYEHFKVAVSASGVEVAAGRFGAMMQLKLCNDGPVTLWLDTAELGLGPG